MTSQRVQAVAVALFALVIAGVVAVLLSRVEREAPTVSSGASQESAGDPWSAAERPTGPVSLAAGEGDLVLRVTAGSCSEPGGPRLELSENTGRSFRQIRVPQVDDGSGVSASSPAVRAIVHAEATSLAKLTVAAADDDCEVHSYTTDDGGGTWSQDSGSIDTWHLDPATGRIVSPTGPTATGCRKLAAYASVSTSAAKAFCSGGTVRSTANGGGLWTDAGELSDVTAAVFTSPQTGYAVVVEGACKSRIHATTDGGLTWTPAGCVAEEFVISGLSGTDERLVAGGTGGVRLSTDDGTSWAAPTEE